MASRNCRILKYSAQDGFMLAKFPNQNVKLKRATSNSAAAAQQLSGLSPERAALFKGGETDLGKICKLEPDGQLESKVCSHKILFLFTWQVFNLSLYKSCKNVSYIVSFLVLARVSGSVHYGYQLNNYPCDHQAFPECQPEILDTTATAIICMIRSEGELKRK